MEVAYAPTRPHRAIAARPGAALGAAAFGIALLPLLAPKLPGNAAPVDAVFLLAIAVTFMWAGTTDQRFRLPYALPVTVLVLAGAVAALLGDYPESGFVAVVQELFLLAWCATIANLARTPDALGFLLRTWAWSATVWAAVLVIVVLAGFAPLAGFEREGGRAQLLFDNPNLAGSYFAVSLLVLWAARPARRSIPWLAAAALVSTALLFTGSNAAIGGLVAGSAVASVIWVVQHRGPIPAVGLVLVMLTTVILTAILIQRSGVIEEGPDTSNNLVRITLGRVERSSEGRAELIQHLFDLFRGQGFWGYGPASTFEVLEAEGAVYVKEAHNDSAAVLAERGVLGGIGLLMLIGSVGIRAARLGGGLDHRYRRAVRSVYPLIAALTALGIGSLTHEVLHYRHLWVLFGIIAGLYLWGRTAPSEERPA